MRIIDAHVHIGRWVSPWRSEDALADMVGAAAECGIGQLVVSSLGDRGYLHYPTPEEFRDANDHVLEAVARYPQALSGLCYASPEYLPESLDEIRRCVRDGPLVGLKLWIARKASDPAVDPLLAAAGELGVYVLQHAWYKTPGNYPHESTPADVAEMARRHPGVTIQMAHLQGAGERGVRDVAPYSNVLIDTSGGDPEAGLLEYAVGLLGAERLVFGSDAPGRDFAVQLGKVVGAALGETEREQILGGNAARLLERAGS
jgi:uncharacterized protein